MNTERPGVVRQGSLILADGDWHEIPVFRSLHGCIDTWLLAADTGTFSLAFDEASKSDAMSLNVMEISEDTDPPSVWVRGSPGQRIYYEVWAYGHPDRP